jgi:hypothetical protein
MKTLAAAAALAAVALLPTPAIATQGQLCGPVSGNGPRLDIVIGTLGIAGVNLVEGGRTRTTMSEGAPLAIRQGWIDEDRLWIDLGDAGLAGDEGRLRLQWSGSGRSRRLAGTFVRHGRLYRLRCSES